MELETCEKEIANVIFAVQTLSANTAKISLARKLPVLRYTCASLTSTAIEMHCVVSVSIEVFLWPLSQTNQVSMYWAVEI